MSDVIEKIVQWQLDIGSKIAPSSDMAVKHIGFVLEECAEALEAIDDKDADVICRVATALKEDYGNHFDQVEFEALADAFADMAVFAIAGLMRCGYDPIRALEAIQESNDSKRMPDGSFLRNEHGKIIKPAHYKAPDLSKARIA